MIEIKTITKEEMLIIALYCMNDNRKKDAEFNKKAMKEIGRRLLTELYDDLLNKKACEGNEASDRRT